MILKEENIFRFVNIEWKMNYFKLANTGRGRNYLNLENRKEKIIT